MKTVEIKQADAEKAYKYASNSEKLLLENLLPNLFVQKEIKDRVNTIEDVIEIYKPSPNLKTFLDYSGIDEDMIAAQNFVLARMITKIFNEGWEPDYTDASQPKYELRFKVEATKDKPTGVGLSLAYCDRWTASTHCGSRLVFKDAATAYLAFEKFPEVYKNYIIK